VKIDAGKPPYYLGSQQRSSVEDRRRDTGLWGLIRFPCQLLVANEVPVPDIWTHEVLSPRARALAEFPPPCPTTS
jgi:hypothetical protein